MQRRLRHAAILELVHARDLSTQAEVAEALRIGGFDVVQTTVSRDIAELGLVKVRTADGGLAYAPSGSVGHGSAPRIGSAIRRFALSVEAAGALVVLRTPSGCASALAQALDEAALSSVAGTIAGDNTIFVALRDARNAAALADEIRGHLLEGAA